MQSLHAPSRSAQTSHKSYLQARQQRRPWFIGSAGEAGAFRRHPSQIQPVAYPAGLCGPAVNGMGSMAWPRRQLFTVPAPPAAQGVNTVSVEGMHGEGCLQGDVNTRYTRDNVLEGRGYNIATNTACTRHGPGYGQRVSLDGPPSRSPRQ